MGVGLIICDTPDKAINIPKFPAAAAKLAVNPPPTPALKLNPENPAPVTPGAAKAPKPPVAATAATIATPVKTLPIPLNKPLAPVITGTILISSWPFGLNNSVSSIS